ncbi:MAG: hypothetical protein ACQEQV_00405 [Fibrobacterota bacterium]
MNRIGKKQLEHLQKKYRTDSAIAALYGISRQAVYKMRRKYGIPPAPSIRSKRNMHIRELAAQGVRPEIIARRFSLSVSSVYRIIRYAPPSAHASGAGTGGGGTGEGCEKNIQYLCSFIRVEAAEYDHLERVRAGRGVHAFLPDDTFLRGLMSGTFPSLSTRRRFAEGFSQIKKVSIFFSLQKLLEKNAGKFYVPGGEQSIFYSGNGRTVQLDMLSEEN